MGARKEAGMFDNLGETIALLAIIMTVYVLVEALVRGR